MTERAIKLDASDPQRALDVAFLHRLWHPADTRGIGMGRGVGYARRGEPALFAYYTKTLLVVREVTP